MNTLRTGADEIKSHVDRDNQSGFPIANFCILLFIALVLYLIWDKLNEKIDPSPKKKAGGAYMTAATSDSTGGYFSSTTPTTGGFIFDKSKAHTF